MNERFLRVGKAFGWSLTCSGSPPARAAWNPIPTREKNFYFVTRGRLVIYLKDREFQLRSGDSFYFESKAPHRWINPGKTEAVILWINTPPTF
ncbi:MAG: cupin domain-containing protein [Bryobacteraceae bacterium]